MSTAVSTGGRLGARRQPTSYPQQSEPSLASWEECVSEATEREPIAYLTAALLRFLMVAALHELRGPPEREELAYPLSFCNLLPLSVAVRVHPSVDVFQTDDVILIELTEGHLKYSDRFVSDGREPVCRPTGNDDSLPTFGPENPTSHLDLSSGIEDHP